MLEYGTDPSLRQDGGDGMAVSEVDDQCRVLHPRVKGRPEDGRRTGIHNKGLKSLFSQNIPHRHHPGHLLWGLSIGEILQSPARADGPGQVLESNLPVQLPWGVAVILHRHSDIPGQGDIEELKSPMEGGNVQVPRLYYLCGCRSNLLNCHPQGLDLPQFIVDGGRGGGGGINLQPRCQVPPDRNS